MAMAAGDPGASLAELLAITGLTVAVATTLVAALTVGIQRRLQRLRRRVGRLEKRLQERELWWSVAQQSEARALRAMEAALDFGSGLHHRLLAERSGEIDADAAMREMRPLRLHVARGCAEARLMAGDTTQQRSALQQLTYQLGDRDTMHLLRAVATHGALGGLGRDEINAAAEALEKRLLAT